jgi:hypothetical protein
MIQIAAVFCRLKLRGLIFLYFRVVYELSSWFSKEENNITWSYMLCVYSVPITLNCSVDFHEDRRFRKKKTNLTRSAIAPTH